MTTQNKKPILTEDLLRIRAEMEKNNARAREELKVRADNTKPIKSYSALPFAEDLINSLSENNTTEADLIRIAKEQGRHLIK